ncbi:aldehyde dehydrogenase domain-containing protein [Dipodascopsis uninucleata]
MLMNRRVFTLLDSWKLCTRALSTTNRGCWPSRLSSKIILPNNIEYDQPRGLFINNKFQESFSKIVRATINPSSEKEIESVYIADKDDIDNAVHAAKSCFHKQWKYYSASERSSLLYILADKIKENAELLAAIESYDTGKPLKRARDEDIEDCINVLQYYAKLAVSFTYEKEVLRSRLKVGYTDYEPYGVCALIIPWNYPLMISIWKVAPALAAGNTIVLKSSEHTPLSALYLASLIKDSGFPPGVINILSGGGETGSLLTKHKDVDKISFTGSFVTGQKVMRAAAENITSVTLELGGKSVAIVFQDADLEQAAKWIYSGSMSNAGQICSATSRVLVHESVYERFVYLIVDYTKRMSVVGDPFDPQTSHGPLISQQQLNKVLKYIELGKSSDARLVLGGNKYDRRGYYVQPTVFSDVKDDAIIAKDEIFGPVICISSFKSTEEVINRANESNYGLAGAIFTADIDMGRKAACQLRSGSVWINSSNDTSPEVPFGGYKHSGFGRDLGLESLLGFLQTKGVHINLNMSL